jgi:hypothetical protein
VFDCSHLAKCIARSFLLAECSLFAAYRCTIHHLLKIQCLPELYTLTMPRKSKRHRTKPYRRHYTSYTYTSPLSSYKYTSPPHPRPLLSSSGQIKSKPLHTTPVFAHQIHARGLRVFRCGKQHALVASGFLFFADAAGLGFCCGGAFGWA